MYSKINTHNRKGKELQLKGSLANNKVYKMFYNLYSVLINAGDSLIIVVNRKLVEKINIIMDKKILERSR